MRWYHEVVMYWGAVCVLLLGVAVGSEGARDKLHTEVRVPGDGSYGYHDEFGGFEEPQISKPSAEYHYGTDDPYGYGKPKRREYHYDDSPYNYEQYNEKPKKQQSGGYRSDNNKPSYEPYSDGYKKSWKILRSEKIETETIDNPHADNPANRYIVKSTHKVREKLPYADTTIGYDHEYAYPISEVEHDLGHNEKIIDFNNAKTDPFYNSGYETPKKNDQQEKKPKKYSYFYKYPSSDYEYDRNVHYVNSYLNKNSPEAMKEPKQSKTHYSDVDSYSPKSEKYHIPSSDHGPSEDDIYRNYKTDGPSYSYF